MLTTTVVGSFPAKPVLSISGIYTKADADPYESALKKAVEAQISAGVSIISDGQVRGDFLRIFAARIGGYDGITLRAKPERNGSIVAGDFALAKKIAGGRARVKGILTGPSTLALNSRIAGAPYKSNADLGLAGDLTEVLCEEARELERCGAAMLGIDEPMFSTGIDLRGRLEFVDAIAAQVRIPVALHVCGDVRGVFDALLKLEHVSILDHEMCGTPQNLEAITAAKLEGTGKRLAYGVIDTRKERVESIDEIAQRIRTATDLFGNGVIIKPDCGLRNLSFESASAKLANMCAAAKKVF